MADNFGQKIFDRNVVIKSLQRVVRDSLTTSKAVKECCKLTSTSMEFDERFKQDVSDYQSSLRAVPCWTFVCFYQN